MKKINFPALLLAFLVIFLFTCSGVAIAYNNLLLFPVFIILGTLAMGYGIYLKKRKNDSIS